MTTTISLPKEIKLKNNGIKCNMLVGDCSCGTNHTALEALIRLITIKKESQPQPEPLPWNGYFMQMAYLAATKSKDPSTKVGAVITSPDHSILSTGFNGLPRGVNDDPKIFERHNQRPSKYSWYEHAERNAIYNSVRVGGASLLDSTLYTPGLPCADCARGIIQSGIRNIIIHKEWREQTEPLITKDQSWAKTRDETVGIMLEEAGVLIEEISLNIPNLFGFFNGKVIFFNLDLNETKFLMEVDHTKRVEGIDY